MLILDLFKPSTWLSGVEKGIMGAIVNGLRTLCFNIDTIIYELIINLYELFETLCEARLLDNSVLNELSKRIGLILGLIMFFYIIFSFIQMLINPDKITDKEVGAGAIVKKVLIVIVMLGSSNFIFSQLYNLQIEIINQNIISRLILPYEISEGTMDSFGNELSAQLMTAFYWVDDTSTRTDLTVDNNNNITACETMTSAFYKQIRTNGKFDLGYSCLNESINVKVTGVDENEEDQIYIIYFNGIISVIAGAFVVYILFMYCLKIGVRMIQLAVLEVISPMAIVSYLSPKKDTMFNKWGKLYFATYIDVFIRIAIINFVIFLILVIFSGTDNGGAFQFWNTIGNPKGTERMFFTVVIVLALLTFAKKAPELIKELLPSVASSKLGFGLGMKEIVGLQKGTKIGAGILGGAVGGAAVGLLAGRPLGTIGGALKGGLSGLKGQGLSKTASSAWKNQAKANAEIAKVRMSGGSWLGHQFVNMQKSVGMTTEADRFDDEKATLERENATYNQVSSKLDDAKKRAKGKIIDGDLKNFKGTNTEQKAIKALEAQNKVELLKASVASLDKTKLTENEYNSQLEALNNQITIETAKATSLMDEAIESYINDGKDIVTVQKMNEAQAIIDNNQKYEGFNDLEKITDFKTFKTASDTSLGKVSENNIKLAKNAQEGKAARANAGK